jgi:hypothetical protein
VREVSFTRKHTRRPDSLITMYYDSLEGLRARGVPVDPVYYPPYNPTPQPWPPTTVSATTSTRRRLRCAATEEMSERTGRRRARGSAPSLFNGYTLWPSRVRTAAEAQARPKAPVTKLAVP